MISTPDPRQVIHNGKTAKAYLERDIVNRKFVSNYARLFTYLLSAEGADEADLLKAVRHLQAFAAVHRGLFDMVVEAEQVVRAMGLSRTPAEVGADLSGDIPLSGYEESSPDANRGVSELVRMAVETTGDADALDEYAAEHDDDF